MAAILAALTLTAFSIAHAEEAEDAYLGLLGVVQQADALDTSGKTDQAMAKYQEAQKGFSDLKKNYRDWNPKLVGFRLSYVTGKIASLTEGANSAAPGSGTKANGAAKAQAISDGIKLLEAGAEPRKVLRLHPKAGDKQPFTMTMKMAMENKVGETQTPAVKLPAIKFTADVEIKEVSADGNITYAMVMGEPTIVEDAEVMPQVVSVMKSSFAGVKGLAGTGVVSARGVIKSADLKVPANADPGMRQTLDQVKEALANSITPLPEEAVGPGAKWQVKLPIKAQGMTIDQTTTCELISVEGDRLAANTTLVQHAANQKIQNPGMPGMKLDLTRMTGKGSGTLNLDLAQIIPLEAKVDSQTDASMSLNMNGQKQAMTTKVVMKLTIEGK